MGHSYSHILLHVVFSTKGRRGQLCEPLRERLFGYMVGVARKEFGSILCMGGTDNHLHALISVRADVSVSEAMRKWKGSSSRWVHKSISGDKSFAWQRGYAAFSVSESNAEQVAEYIRTQQEHHRELSFEDEFIALLKRHKVDYDPEYVFG